jgi:hypothetical protein
MMLSGAWGIQARPEICGISFFPGSGESLVVSRPLAVIPHWMTNLQMSNKIGVYTPAVEV